MGGIFTRRQDRSYLPNDRNGGIYNETRKEISTTRQEVDIYTQLLTKRHERGVSNQTTRHGYYYETQKEDTYHTTERGYFQLDKKGEKLNTTWEEYLQGDKTGVTLKSNDRKLRRNGVFSIRQERRKIKTRHGRNIYKETTQELLTKRQARGYLQLDKKGDDLQHDRAGIFPMRHKRRNLPYDRNGVFSIRQKRRKIKTRPGRNIYKETRQELHTKRQERGNGGIYNETGKEIKETRQEMGYLQLDKTGDNLQHDTAGIFTMIHKRRELPYGRNGGIYN
ncbi:unnamed protein product [Mytilus coruscus]|uniref:Uncharacterized protein n=1 Tax=Mytilus coruscus TaxID=42192 RepID=A0A6J8AX45_MYTCO|nr:unnamed protein product [Mytilus coruscus]